MISKYQKVFPRVDYHDYLTHNFYTYVYLDPFAPKQLKYRINGKLLEFAFEPFYIGRSARGRSFRHNQHIKEHLMGEENKNNIKIHNRIKKDKFRELESNMRKFGNSSPDYPSTWDEYQKHWIIILNTYDTVQQLNRHEEDLIRSIGTKKRGTGILTNANLG